MRCADDNVSALEVRKGHDQVESMRIIAFINVRRRTYVIKDSKIASELNEKSLARLRTNATTMDVNSGLSRVERRTLA